MTSDNPVGYLLQMVDREFKYEVHINDVLLKDYVVDYFLDAYHFYTSMELPKPDKCAVVVTFYKVSLIYEQYWRILHDKETQA